MAKHTQHYTCQKHGRWRPPHAPKSECVDCWSLYGLWRFDRDQKLKVKSVGRAKGGGQSSKKKGRDAVLLVAETLVKHFGWHPDDALVKATSMLGIDLHLSPRACADFPFSIEAKNVEALNIWAALKQADENAKPGRPGIVFFKRANTRLYVALDASTFLHYARPSARPLLTHPVYPGEDVSGQNLGPTHEAP